ncbi:hypothetical protein H4219_005906 [Mycoemilia scoparia]|uniref:HMG box domain-containing protein n=1 Tax=Mycoemilia scoparia TaxID=417184 RepID=A0A9W7ZVI6_9FUNG|nr:hypothetical protein H4219_005906 [Mycoemilia scoparia]
MSPKVVRERSNFCSSRFKIPTNGNSSSSSSRVRSPAIIPGQSSTPSLASSPQMSSASSIESNFPAEPPLAPHLNIPKHHKDSSLFTSPCRQRLDTYIPYASSSSISSSNKSIVNVVVGGGGSSSGSCLSSIVRQSQYHRHHHQQQQQQQQQKETLAQKQAKRVAHRLLSRSPNAFMLYRSEKGRLIKQDPANHGINQTLISQRTSRNWKHESQSTKSQYQAKQKALKKLHDKYKLDWIDRNIEEVEALAKYEGLKTGGKGGGSGGGRRNGDGILTITPKMFIGILSPPNTFILYRNDNLRKVAEQNPGINQKDVSKKVAEAWGKESEKVKNKYKELCVRLKKEKVENIAAIEEKYIMEDYKNRCGEDLKKLPPLLLEALSGGGGGGGDDEDENVDIDGEDEDYVIQATPTAPVVRHSANSTSSSSSSSSSNNNNNNHILGRDMTKRLDREGNVKDRNREIGLKRKYDQVNEDEDDDYCDCEYCKGNNDKDSINKRPRYSNEIANSPQYAAASSPTPSPTSTSSSTSFSSHPRPRLPPLLSLPTPKSLKKDGYSDKKMEEKLRNSIGRLHRISSLMNPVAEPSECDCEECGPNKK